ncbi:MAG: hypothetical protein ACOY45_17080 [Pseudomonadota bacterium]
MKALFTLSLLALTLAGCGASGGSGGAVVPRSAGSVPVPGTAAGAPGNIMGADARRLYQSFGDPVLDVQEGAGRKLQFVNGICVLDAYLYVPRGKRDPVVTYVDARQRNGAPIDPASCIAALRRR